MKYMLDTNICIYIIKQKPPQVLETFQRLEVGDVCISTITLAELEYGVAKSLHREKNQTALAAFLVPLDILPFSDKAALACGKVRAALEKKGLLIGPYDLLISSHALSEGLTLVTNNLSEFQHIPGLPVENWVQETS
ncbi:MAG: type II toxin-antitoxin system VapC family toxin [Dethiobacter sp.]|jgi:tRNA(fMet)-specific endonuclease VapC|nr:MAG: type II toxin-antitoxin system VapC family toxin [Dethiobacter sp.]